MKHKKISFKIMIVIFLIGIISINIKPISKVLTNNKNNLKDGNADVNVVANNDMIDVENLIGRYQFNYTGATDRMYQNSPNDEDTGYSHLPELAEYENDKEWASSSGGYIDKSYNIIDGNEGNVKKAYLVIEFNGSGAYNNPITVVYGGEDGAPKASKELYVDTYVYRTDGTYYNDVGYIDITDWFKENGYGWYYVCNIPYVKIADTSADWKIVLIEENEKLPVRMLKLQFGAAFTTNDYKYLTVEGDGIVTKKTGNVTGQFIYNITNVDGKNCGSVQIATGDSDDLASYEYSNVVAANGYRTGSTPLYFLKSRNTEPITTKTNFTTDFYTDNNTHYVGSDVELLDIDGTTNVHNIVIPNGKKKIVLRYKGAGYVLVTNILGMAIDIDVASYESVQKAELKDNDDGRVTISGTTKCTSELDNVGLYNGVIEVTIDNNLVLDPETIQATFKDSEGNETTLDSSMWSVDGNVITFNFGKDASARSKSGDSISYSFKSLANKAPGAYTINNTVKSSGKLVATGSDNETIDTDYKMDNVGWTTSTVYIPVQNDLVIDPNGGKYKNKTTKYIARGITNHETYTVDIPEKEGYALWKWELVSGENGAEVVDRTHVIMGDSDTEVKAIYYEDVNNNGIPDIEEYRTIIYTDGVDNEDIFEDQKNEKLFDGDDTPSFVGNTPVRRNYIFSGWDNEISQKVNGDKTYKAVWVDDKNNNGTPDSEEEHYTVTYTDGVNGTAFTSQVYNNLVIDVDTPSYSGTPTRTKYVFDKWTPNVSDKVSGNVTYVAEWKADRNENSIPDSDETKYTVRYTDGINGASFRDIIFNDLIVGDNTPNSNITPTRDGYIFKGWTPIVSSTVTSSAVYTAVWKEDRNKNNIADDEEDKYTVKYVDGVNNTVFNEQTYSNLLVNEATPAFNGTPTRTKYLFGGWSPSVSDKVSGNVTYIATWYEDFNEDGIKDSEQPRYIVIYEDGLDNTIFAKQEIDNILPNMNTPEYSGNTPTRNGYVFSGWNPTVANKVTKDVTYKAVWKEDKNKNGIPDSDDPKYKVRYEDGANGEVFEPVEYEILVGLDTPSFEGEPTRDGYINSGWSPRISDIVSDNVTYAIVWKKDKNKDKIPDDEQKFYTVRYTDGEDGKIFDDIVYEDILEGTNPPEPSDKILKRDNYNFKGWKKVVDNEHITYVAIWEKIINPNTGDTILKYFGLLVISIIGITLSVKKLKA